jgi:hypothetical protein
MCWRNEVNLQPHFHADTEILISARTELFCIAVCPVLQWSDGYYSSVATVVGVLRRHMLTPSTSSSLNFLLPLYFGSCSSSSSCRWPGHYSLSPSVILRACYVSIPYQHIIFCSSQNCVTPIFSLITLFILISIVWGS